jgi:hypothetical protein
MTVGSENSFTVMLITAKTQLSSITNFVNGIPRFTTV